VTRQQNFVIRELLEDEVRLISVKCPSCNTGSAFEVGMDNACGASQCWNCHTWFEYKEYYKEVEL